MDLYLSSGHKILREKKRYYDKKKPTRRSNCYADKKSITNNHRRKRCRIRDQKISNDLYVPKFYPKTLNWWDCPPYNPKMKLKTYKKLK
tara:strand:+ start:186 stop:452 length:267 start_codon:yes stop_codon:yes gene_type:complete